MTLAIGTVDLAPGLTAALIGALDRNAAEAVCRCGVYLAYNTLTGKLGHVDACRFCFDPRTCERDPVCTDTNHHACTAVAPVTCEHGWHGDRPARLFTDCLAGLAECCNCCHPADYDPNDP